MSSCNNTNGEQGCASSEASENSQNQKESRESHDQCIDNESEDWILDELQYQYDDQLQADIDRQMEDQLWNEMDEQLERQMDEQIQSELNQQFDDLLATQNDSLAENSRKIRIDRGLILQDVSLKAPIESFKLPNTESEASAFSINAQIQKVVEQYEGLNLESAK